MSFRFTREVLKISVGQICQNIGWHAVQSSPMDILVDVSHRYLREICKAVHSYSNQYNRIEPNLDDVALAFKDLGIILQEIEEYVSNVEPVPFAHKVPAFPLKHPSKILYPIPTSGELLHPPEHIPGYLPLMHPDLEEEDGLLSPVLESGQKKSSMENSGATADGESTSPLNSPKHGIKRPNEWSNDIPVSKKPRHYTEEEGRPMREMTSVFMTPTGFISPAREGRAPDPTLPNTFDSPPSTPEPPPPSETIPVKKESKSKESKKDKSSKSKKDKESNKKDVKKIKTSKKENKENTAFSSEKSVVPSSSSKKEHTNSHKSGKSDKSSAKSSDPNHHTKIKIDKIKHKEGKDEHKKSKDHSKSSKNKSKIKHSSSSSKSLKSSKAPKSPQKSTIKSPKKSSSKSPKNEKKSHTFVAIPPFIPVLPPPPPPLPPPAVIKKELEEVVEMSFQVKEEKVDVLPNDIVNDDYEERIDSREESPEPRLVIDDSLETQVRQERESRLALFDASINAVIQRGQEESEMEAEKSHKAVDDVINEVARGPVMRKFEPKDIYEFTDSSELSSLSSLEPGDVDDDDSSIDVPIVKKEKVRTPEMEVNFENHKKSKSKEKQSKKAKDSKPKSPGLVTSPKNRKSPNVIVKREERSPSRIRLKEDIFSSDASSLSPSPSPPPSFSELPSQKNVPSSMSDLPQTSPFVHSPSIPSTSFSPSPFAPIPSLPCHIQANSHFPTPPLFVTTKQEPNAFPDMCSPQPLNLAKSSSSSFSKGTPEAKISDSHHLSLKTEDFVDAPKKSESSADKDKSKLHRKEKKEKDKKSKVKKKKEMKEKEKEKTKVKAKSESAKEKEKPKEVIKDVPKESPPKPKPEKVVKKRGRPEKKKNKDKVQKNNDDSVTKLTLKFAGGSSGSGQFVIKPSSKRLSSPPSSSPGREDASLSPINRSPTPPPPPPPSSKAAPAVSVLPSPPPVRQPSPTPTMIDFQPPVTTPIQPPATKTHSRGRGRGRKPAAQPVAPPPPARTVITETLGTIVDEQGNKIWICPACTRPDDGSPMIGCDECDDWYHWVCVGIVVPPKEEESWYCTRCISKRQCAPVKQRRKKHKKGK